MNLSKKIEKLENAFASTSEFAKEIVNSDDAMQTATSVRVSFSFPHGIRRLDVHPSLLPELRDLMAESAKANLAEAEEALEKLRTLSKLEQAL